MTPYPMYTPASLSSRSLRISARARLGHILTSIVHLHHPIRLFLLPPLAHTIKALLSCHITYRQPSPSTTSSKIPYIRQPRPTVELREDRNHLPRLLAAASCRIRRRLNRHNTCNGQFRRHRSRGRGAPAKVHGVAGGPEVKDLKPTHFQSALLV